MSEQLSEHFTGHHNHFDGRRFFTPGAPPMATWKRVLRWWFSRRHRGFWPRKITPGVAPERRRGRPLAAGETCAVTWVNHSTFLIETAHGNFLTDPVFSPCAGPLGLFGPKRVHAPGIAFDDLPPIDCVLLSHDHYDHCDMRALRRIARRDFPAAVTLLRNGDLLREAGFEHVAELDWWAKTRIGAGAGDDGYGDGGVEVTATPAQHWSTRALGARNGRLWGGFWLEITGGPRIYFAGDTGYNTRLFPEIRRRLGNPDLALLPVGAYAPRWFMSPQHCDPAQAVRIHLDLGARRSVAMHWGCFRLTDEARDDPPRELAAEREKANLPPDAFRVLQPGECLRL
ncbi:MAG: MBL fold metallo-hydrolase [Puniceicoccales bacterium]|jgi:L-ascorbate metabolism protein UlaG (beta-lactamase superfamily)|nr:MBL fold metallo-hydrolase [Puniceicoccales bacterium]